MEESDSYEIEDRQTNRTKITRDIKDCSGYQNPALIKMATINIKANWLILEII